MAVPKGSLWLRAQLGIPPLLLLAMALAGGSGTASAEAFACIAHVACHAVITWLSCTTHLADHAMIM